MALNLETVPQILDYLVSQGSLSAAQKMQTLDASKAGEKGFAGEVAVRHGFLSQAQLDNGLAGQSALKAEAALKDIALIEKSGTQNTKPFLKVNWGNNGVNPAAQNPSPVDGASAAANMAQNIVMLANAHPELAKDEKIKQAIEAGAALTRGIVGKGPLDHANLAALQEKLQAGLVKTAEGAGGALKDSKGADIALEDFIRERGKEIAAGGGEAIQRSLEAGVREISGGFNALARGDFGSGVASLQQFLASDKGGHHKLKIDGQFGSDTKAVLIAYQKRASPPIEHDGLLGTQTLETMRRDGFDLATSKEALTKAQPELMKRLELLDNNREELRTIRKAHKAAGVSGGQGHEGDVQNRTGGAGKSRDEGQINR